MSNKNGPKDSDFDERMHWFFLAAYIADCVNLLDESKKAKLAGLVSELSFEQSWQEMVTEAHGIEPKFVRGVYELCIERGQSREQAVAFIFRGLGCPDKENLFEEYLYMTLA